MSYHIDMTNFKVFSERFKSIVSVNLETIGDEEYDLIAAGNENQMMGRLRFSISNGFAKILDVESKRGFQSHGVAKALLDCFEYIAAKKDCTHVSGCCFITDDFSKMLYEKNNYLICDADYHVVLQKRLDKNEVLKDVGKRILEIKTITPNSDFEQ